MQPTYLSDVSKVADVLRNFSDYRKKLGKRGSGKTWPGLGPLKKRTTIVELTASFKIASLGERSCFQMKTN